MSITGATGSNIRHAVRQALHSISTTGASCAVAATDAERNAAIESTARLFSVSRASPSGPSTTSLFPTSFPILPAHVSHQDSQLSFGLSRYPITPGHALSVVRSGTDLFSLQQAEFIDALTKVSTTASPLTERYGVGRCTLVAEGDDNLSIIPLHGLSEQWHPVTSEVKEFHEQYPGYISSNDGPIMPDERHFEATWMYSRLLTSTKFQRRVFHDTRR